MVLERGAAPAFKYADNLASLANCPPKEWEEREYKIAFRFVWLDERAPNSYRPVQMNDPARSFHDSVELCENFALSSFDTEAHARTLWTKIKNGGKHDPRLILGTHLVSVTIKKTDGLSSLPDKRGHVDLHEYHHADLSLSEKMIGELA
jgi:hypothetical protein